MKIAVVRSDYYKEITDGMMEGVMTEIQNKIKSESKSKVEVEEFQVFGGFEIPLIVKMLAEKGGYDGFVVLGCVIKGETDQSRLIVEAVTNALMDLSLQYMVPVGFGLLSTDNYDQALARSRGDINRGCEAMKAVFSFLS